MFYHSIYKAIIIVFFLLIILSKNALAWSGFDYENNTTIEIGSGNLVRENLIITIFDWSTNQYHDVEVLEMDDSFGDGLRLIVMDLETNKRRIFEMEN